MASVQDNKHYRVKVLRKVKLYPNDTRLWAPGPNYTMTGAATKQIQAIEGQADALEVGNEVEVA
jgi:hypothetical protein